MGSWPRPIGCSATLLADPKQAKKPALWRLAAELAGRREQKARELECLERALDAEYRNLPEVINLEQVRARVRPAAGPTRTWPRRWSR